MIVVAERGGKVTIGKGRRERGRKKHEQILCGGDETRIYDLNQAVIMAVPVARETRATGGFFAHLADATDFFFANQENVEREIGVGQELGHMHEFIENVLE